MNRRFKLNIFLIATVCIFLLTLLSFYGAVSEDDPGNEGSFVLGFLSGLYNILRFPTHTLFWEFFSQAGFFSVGLLLNSAIYALIIERVSGFFRKKGTTYYG
jgi:hypothetical protein